MHCPAIGSNNPIKSTENRNVFCLGSAAHSPEDLLSAAHEILFYVVDWLPPDFGAVGQYGIVFAQELARDGGAFI
jgi:hypothetical protein